MMNHVESALIAAALFPMLGITPGVIKIRLGAILSSEEQMELAEKAIENS
jgi:hypothetical protein